MRNSSTCGSIARTPAARASNASKRSSGFSQISRRQDLCRRSISCDRPSSIVALQPVGDQKHDRALAQHAARPSLVEALQAMRRCGCRPSQSLTSRGALVERLVRIRWRI